MHNQYNEFYEPNKFSYDISQAEHMQTVIARGKEFFENNTPNIPKIKTALTIGRLKSRGDIPVLSFSRAKEVMRSLYRQSDRPNPGKISQLIGCGDMRAIIENYGMNITAHGIEQAKGDGICTLLMICMSGIIRVPQSSWGRLTGNDPSISPIPHGPYYIIQTTQADSVPLVAPYRLSDMEYILVPFEENIEAIKSSLLKLELDGGITADMVRLFSSKLISYSQLRLHLESRPTPALQRPYPPITPPATSLATSGHSVFKRRCLEWATREDNIFMAPDDEPTLTSTMLRG